MKNPCVTVFIPVFNGRLFLAEAIKSILVQSFSDFEILIIDDGSTDGSYTVVESFEDRRIRYLSNSINKGISFTRNRAIKEAKGEFIAFLDADDVALPARLDKQVNYLYSHPHIIGCGSHASIINNNGKDIGASITVPIDSDSIKGLLAFQNVFVNSTMMIRLDILKTTKGYYGGLCEDYEMAIQLNHKHVLANINEVLVKYRLHDNNISVVFLNKMREAEKYVVGCIHQQLGIKKNEKLINAHHHVLIKKNKDLYPIRDYQQLFVILKRANRNKGIYPEPYFERLLFVLWYDKIREVGGRKAFFVFFNKSLFYRKAVSFKMIRKIIKQSFWFKER